MVCSSTLAGSQLALRQRDTGRHLRCCRGLQPLFAAAGSANANECHALAGGCVGHDDEWTVTLGKVPSRAGGISMFGPIGMSTNGQHLAATPASRAGFHERVRCREVGRGRSSRSHRHRGPWIRGTHHVGLPLRRVGTPTRSRRWKSPATLGRLGRYFPWRSKRRFTPPARPSSRRNSIEQQIDNRARPGRTGHHQPELEPDRRMNLPNDGPRSAT